MLYYKKIRNQKEQKISEAKSEDRQMNLSQTALIVIDMQEDYIGKTCKYNFYPVTLIDKINEKIAIAIKRSETIIYVKNAGTRNQIPYVSHPSYSVSLSLSTTLSFFIL